MQPGLTLWILASSVLLVLSFPRPDLGMCSLFALVPLFTALSRLDKWKALLAGWGAGTLWFFVSYNWVSHSLIDFGGIPFLPAQGAILLLAGIHGVYVALFSWLIPVVAAADGNGGVGVSEYRGVWGRHDPATRLFMHSLAPVLVLPSAWVVLETARSWFPLPFPWLMLGTSMWKIPYFRPLYEIAGVHGVSFWIVAVNVLIWIAARTGKGGRIRTGSLLVLVLLLPVILYPLTGTGTGQKIRVAIVQGNYQQELKWKRDLLEETIDTYLSLTEEAVKKGAQLVVWPETAVPTYYQAEPEVALRLRRFASMRGIHLVFGSPGFFVEEQELLLYNRVYHLAPGGNEEFYDKTMLVPFGEYVPLADIMPFIDKLVPGEGEFARGVWKGPFKSPLPSGALVCYEISFPSLARREVRDGCRLLINVTNDAWFGPSWGPYQHLAISAVRALENSVPVLRAANTGVSAVIDRGGRVLKNIPLNKRGVVIADIEGGAGMTLYTRLGDWIFILSLAVISVYCMLLCKNSWRLKRWIR